MSKKWKVGIMSCITLILIFTVIGIAIGSKKDSKKREEQPNIVEVKEEPTTEEAEETRPVESKKSDQKEENEETVSKTESESSSENNDTQMNGVKNPIKGDKTTKPKGKTEETKKTSEGSGETSDSTEETSAENETSTEESSSSVETTPSVDETPEGEKPTSSVDETQESEQPTLPEKHIWGVWVAKDAKEEVRVCSHCGKKETQPHSYSVIKKQFVYKENEMHTLETAYSCTSCSRPYTEREEKGCQFTNWNYVENSTEERTCKECNHKQARPHQHAEPETLTYSLKVSNGDGTHVLEASYTCSVCSEVIVKSKEEACDYEITSYKPKDVNDIHLEVKDCKTCGDHKEEEGECIPVGDITAVKESDFKIYEYYECELCKDSCRKTLHVNHVFGPFENRDSDTHIRYCFCSEEREVKDHVFEYNKNMGDTIVKCPDCHAEKQIPAHDHGYDTYDEMSLMDLIKSPAYKLEIVSASQKANPNPSPEAYCSRYEFICKTCRIMYYIEYKHKFVDGKCTRVGYCGGIEEAS